MTARKKVLYFAHAQLRRFAVPLDKLHLDPDNEKDHDRAGIDLIKASLRAFGWRELVHLHGDTVTRGNGTITAAAELRNEAASEDPKVRAGATLFPKVEDLDYTELVEGEDYDVVVDWEMGIAIDFNDTASVNAAWRLTHNRSQEKGGSWNWARVGMTVASLEGEFDWGSLGWADELAEFVAPNHDGEGEMPEHKDPGPVDPNDIPPYEADRDFYLIKVENVPPALKDAAIAAINESIRGLGDGSLVARAY